jgi:hypothetical protein
MNEKDDKKIQTKAEADLRDIARYSLGREQSPKFALWVFGVIIFFVPVAIGLVFLMDYYNIPTKYYFVVNVLILISSNFININFLYLSVKNCCRKKWLN